ncbi:hypothetical protein [Tsuneonella sp. SYSU-LHT278]|uniref:hypothetical protein n=1 Tax=Tsuneonella sediminis TaxID=3416089 RepID=UPI003F7AFEBF
MRPLFLLAALTLPLAACDRQSPETADTGTAIPVEPDGGIGGGAPPPSAAPSPSATPSPDGPPDTPERGIPTALQGRWGLVPADCTSTRGDAKGLLRVSATALTFYESVARLGAVEDRSDNSITAAFAFSGEGMTWTRKQQLTARGDTLTRVERADGQSPATYTYTKCAT